MGEATPTTPAGVRQRSQLALLLKTMRPKQWTKNVFVWAALVFDVKLFQLEPFLRTLAAFILFCLISSAVYIINDLVDMPKDRLHPEKRNRPLASGALNPSVAIAGAIVIVIGCLPAALYRQLAIHRDPVRLPAADDRVLVLAEEHGHRRRLDDCDGLRAAGCSGRGGGRARPAFRRGCTSA